MHNLYDHINYLIPLWQVKHIYSRRKSDDSQRWITGKYLLSPVPRKQRLIGDKWDREVKELWPLQVAGNTGEIGLCLYWGVCVCKPSHSCFWLSYRLHSTQLGNACLKSVNQCSCLLPHNMIPQWITVSDAHTHTLAPCQTLGDSNRPLKVRVGGQEGIGVGGKVNSGTPWLTKHELSSNCINNKATGWWWGRRSGRPWTYYAQQQHKHQRFMQRL